MKVLKIRQNKKNLLIIVLITVLLLTGLYLSGVFWPSPLTGASKLVHASKGLNQYEISVDFNPEAKMLTCKQKVVYTNKTGDSLPHLYFHLYPNAYQYEDKPVFEKADWNQAYPNGFSPGFLELSNVWINEKAVNFVIGGYSEDILMLFPENGIAPDEKLIIEMEYSVLLPDCMGRFGYGRNMYKIVNWYPIACVYDENGWNLDPYYIIGDPFYSDAANYEVMVSAPSEYILAATGEVQSKKNNGENTIWEIRALAVRDFSLLAGNTFKTLSRQVGKTLLTSYYYTEAAGRKALDCAAESLAYFNEAFGEYPYPQYAVVESDFYIGGMEYPNLIMLDHSLYQSSNSSYLELVTVHETAHQWWYGLVGNDQIADAWMDEGLTEYSTVLYYGNRYGKETEKEIYQNVIGEGKYRAFSSYQNYAATDETIHRPSYEFLDWINYDLLVYGKGAMLFHSLREEMGEEKFLQSLQKYYKDKQFQNAKKSDLIQAFNQVTGLDWQQHFDKWLYDAS